MYNLMDVTFLPRAFRQIMPFQYRHISQRFCGAETDVPH